LLTKRAITTCAAMALAMVFSVQQGEHGPLVVYKLKLPEKTSEAAARPAPTLAPTLEELLPSSATAMPSTEPVEQTETSVEAVAAKQPRLSSLKPAILGTVVMPRKVTPERVMAKRVVTKRVVTERIVTGSVRPAPAGALPIALLPAMLQPAPETLDPVPTTRVVSEAAGSDPLPKPEADKVVTLDEVTRAIEWRRDTLDYLPEEPFAPRF